MANQKKITNKDRDQQLGYLTNTLTRCFNVLGAYIEYKGDEVEFKKFLVEKDAEAKKKWEEKNKNDAKNVVESSDKGDS